MNFDKHLIKKLQNKTNFIRRESLILSHIGEVAHLGGSLSEVEIIVCLYYHVLNVDPKNPDWRDRDRFILSKAHACQAQYVALMDRGFFPKEWFKKYGEVDCPLQAHSDMRRIPGVENTGGSLGQGLSFAVGIALGAKLLNKIFYIYCLIGDGECNEGQIWEAAMAASKYKLDNLISIMDYNKLSAAGFCNKIMPLEPIFDKWKSFGWEVIEIDGHNIEQILEALYKGRKNFEKPAMIIAHTIKGKGVSFMEYSSNWHTGGPNKEQLERALKELPEVIEEDLS